MTAMTDAETRAAKANDRNAVIAFVIGMVFAIGGLLIAVTAPGTAGGPIALLGLVLIVLGIVFKGRRPRR
jgi:ABC-type Mn2+/Zn2+ transport system permease subunit